MKRVVVTGCGVVSPLGNTLQEFFENLLAGHTGFAPITHFDAKKTGITLAGEVKNFNPLEKLSRKWVKRCDLSSQYALVAALDAVKASELDLETLDKKSFGVIMGSGIGGMTTFEEQVEVIKEKGPQKIHPFFVPMVIANMVSGNVSLFFGAENISETIITACASATNAIGEAFEKIKLGKAKVMLAGGAEATICESGIAGFAALKALSPATDPEAAALPFDQRRQGFVMGEGAGVLVLEELEYALKRNAPILGEIVGYGANCDAYHLTAPRGDGKIAALAIEEALREGSVKKEEIGYVNAHGTGTSLNDTTETTVLKNVFGEDAPHIPISSTKSMTGHLLGASGAIEAIATLETLRTGWVHPTANLKEADDTCDLDYVKEGKRKVDPKYALSESFGFGGHNAVLLLKKWEEK